MAGPYDFTGQNIENTYQRVIQTPDGVTFYDGTGSLVTLPSGTPTFPYTGSAIISGSLTITGSLNAPSITGSLLGTASWAYSSSQAITASYALNGGVTSVNVAGTGLSINQTTGNVIITGTGGGGGNTATGSYGSFYDTGSQTATSATAIYSMSLSTTDISNGVYVGGPSKTRVYVTNAGVYNFQFSAQFRNTDTSKEQHVAIWIRKNNVDSGNDIVDSNSFISVSKATGNNAGETIAAWNFLLQLAAGDFIELLWHAETANVITLETIAAGTNPVHPRTPSLILTANRVDQFLSNTGSFTGSFTGNLIGTASWANNYNETDPIFVEKSASLATTGSNTFIGDQTISGSLAISGSVTADNLWYKWTLTNLPLDTYSQYTIVPATPGYLFVQAYYIISSVYFPLGTQIENNRNTTVTISNPIHLGTPSNNDAIWKYDEGNIGPYEIKSKFTTIGSNVMIDISTDPIIVTIDGNPSDTGVIDVTVTGYLKKI